MTAPLAAARCLNHGTRPAAGRCLECTRSYCRECLTEHAGRLTCVGCLQKNRAPAITRRNRLRHLAPPLLGAAALVGSWLFFYTAGVWLESVSAPSHGTAARSK